MSSEPRQPRLIERYQRSRTLGAPSPDEQECGDAPDFLSRLLAAAGSRSPDAASRAGPDTASAGRPPAGPDNPPESVGGMRVIRVLGRGGMGWVLEAEDPRLRRRVAVKLMLPAVAANPAARERFLREARAQAAIEHEHVAPVFAVDDAADPPYLVMPLLKGRTLADHLAAAAGPLPTGEVLRIAGQMAAGLAAAHAAGLVHRDVKPGNVWLEGGTGRVLLLDFGLARATSGADDAPLTRPGDLLGTPGYMAPEQAAGGEVDHRADLFSLGCVVYEAATGRRAFGGDSLLAVVTALATETPPPVRSLNRAVPAGLAELVEGLLAKPPDRRTPGTAAGLLDRLDRLTAAASAGKPPAVPPPAVGGPHPRRLAVAVAVALLLGGVAAGLAGTLAGRGGRPGEGGGRADPAAAEVTPGVPTAEPRPTPDRPAPVAEPELTGRRRGAATTGPPGVGGGVPPPGAEWPGEQDYRTGYALEYGFGAAIDRRAALAAFRKAAAAGHPLAQACVAEHLRCGRYAGKDEGEAERLEGAAAPPLCEAADRGDARAQTLLGGLCEFGRGGLPRDEAVAVRWYRRAADQGDPRGQTSVGWMHEFGRGGLPADEAEAVRWYRKAADQGYATAQCNLGNMCAGGRGVARDEAAAVAWYARAARQGNEVAQNSLGTHYQDGRGVPQDEAEAVRWYRKAADQGYASAQVNLGLLYVRGRGGLAPDAGEGFRWMGRAAAQGDAAAQYNLGVMHEGGLGVAKDVTEAARWYQRAADQGHEDAARALARLAEPRARAATPASPASPRR